ncbi:MAG: zf-HC2 domain-containing protein [Phycisphaerae bacterium]|nr:zf-HC2 domain-containing protein [Phycisphaerae bacterium]
MSCTRTIEVHRYHDGELPPGQKAALEAHVAACAECSQLLADLRSVSVLIRRAPLADLPAAAADRLAQCRPWTADAGLIRVAGWLTAAAAAVLIIALLRKPVDSSPMVAGPALWETLVVTPSADIQDEAISEVVLAKWMADELSTERTGDLR